MRLLDAGQIEDVAVGAAVLGTGGGGDPYLGTLVALHALELHGPPRLLEPEELADDQIVAFPFIVGSPVPGVEKIPFGDEMIGAYRALEAFLGERISALMSAEIGGANSMIPLALGSMLGLPVVDGDLIGRAYPEIQLTSLMLNGINVSPIALADEHGNEVVVSTADNLWAERLARSISIEFGAICGAMGCRITGRQVKDATIHGSISYAERIGRAIREARARKGDAVEAIVAETSGTVLFTGKLVDVQRRTAGGWALGEATLEGIDGDLGSRLSVRFQNENLIAVRDGATVAVVPNLITILDLESGHAITTEHLRYGFRVVVIGIPCDPIWRTEAGIALGGPGHWGYDVEYVPLEAAAR